MGIDGEGVWRTGVEFFLGEVKSFRRVGGRGGEDEAGVGDDLGDEQLVVNPAYRRNRKRGLSRDKGRDKGEQMRKPALPGADSLIHTPLSVHWLRDQAPAHALFCRCLTSSRVEKRSTNSLGGPGTRGKL